MKKMVVGNNKKKGTKQANKIKKYYGRNGYLPDKLKRMRNNNGSVVNKQEKGAKCTNQSLTLNVKVITR